MHRYSSLQLVAAYGTKWKPELVVVFFFPSLDRWSKVRLFVNLPAHPAPASCSWQWQHKLGKVGRRPSPPVVPGDISFEDLQDDDHRPPAALSWEGFPLLIISDGHHICRYAHSAPGPWPNSAQRSFCRSTHRCVGPAAASAGLGMEHRNVALNASGCEG